MRTLETKIPPPLVMVLLGVMAWTLAHLLPMLTFRLPIHTIMATAVAIAGLALNGLPKLAFGRAGTTVNPLRPGSAAFNWKRCMALENLVMPTFKIIRRGHLPIDLVKLVVCAIMFTHGAHRYIYGDIAGLTASLVQFGLPFPLVEAHLITLAETGGTLLIALGLFVRSCSAVLIVIFLTGIVLVHWPAGFFILGPGEGGWEFSALLIACFAAVALDYPPSQLSSRPSEPTLDRGAA